MLETVNPATGEVLDTFPLHGSREVDAAVAAAREAAVWWAGLDWSGRRLRLFAWKSYLTRYMGRLAQLVHEETGKPLDDAKLEIILAIVHIDWAAKHARRVLRPRRVRSGLAAINLLSSVEYLPLGVIGVIIGVAGGIVWLASPERGRFTAAQAVALAEDASAPLLDAGAEQDSEMRSRP